MMWRMAENRRWYAYERDPYGPRGYSSEPVFNDGRRTRYELIHDLEKRFPCPPT